MIFRKTQVKVKKSFYFKGKVFHFKGKKVILLKSHFTDKKVIT